jgi:hypothetical protein
VNRLAMIIIFSYNFYILKELYGGIQGIPFENYWSRITE